MKQDNSLTKEIDMEPHILKYDPPKDEMGNPYWVPVVAKNKDYLNGFLEGMHTMSSVADLSLSDISISLGSDRFNDILPDGRRIKNISKSEFKNHIKNQILRTKEISDLSRSHQGFDPDILGEYFLTIDCSCGNFVAFRDAYEIPEEEFDCCLCGKRLIDYTGNDDYEYDYDGDPGDVEGIVQKINEELGGDDEDEEHY